MKNEVLAYLTSMSNLYQREHEDCSTFSIQGVLNDLSNFESFVMDLNETTTDNTLTLNADLRANARTYQSDLAMKEATITTLANDCNELYYKISSKNQIEAENKMLEAENSKLRSQLAMSTVNENIIRELRADNHVMKTSADTWAILYKDLLRDYKKASQTEWEENI